MAGGSLYQGLEHFEYISVLNVSLQSDPGGGEARPEWVRTQPAIPGAA